MYCDRELRAKGFPYECSHDRFRQVLVVKTHETERRPQNKNVEEDIPVPEYDRAVLLIRDPYNFIVANRHGSHLGVAREDGFFTEGIQPTRLLRSKVTPIVKITTKILTQIIITKRISMKHCTILIEGNVLLTDHDYSLFYAINSDKVD